MGSGGPAPLKKKGSWHTNCLSLWCPCPVCVQAPAGVLSAEAQEAAAAAAYPDAAGPTSPVQPPAMQQPWQRPQAQSQPPLTAQRLSVVSNPPASRAAGLSISLPPDEYVSVRWRSRKYA